MSERKTLVLTMCPQGNNVEMCWEEGQKGVRVITAVGGGTA